MTDDPVELDHEAHQADGWHRWGRWAMLSAVLLFGGLFGADPETWEGSTPEETFAGGLLLAALAVATLGLLTWLVARWIFRRPGWSYSRAALAPGVLAAVFAMLFLAPVGRETSRTADSPTSATARDPLGMRLAGQSDQISPPDRELIRLHNEATREANTALEVLRRDYLEIDDPASFQRWVTQGAARLHDANASIAHARDFVAQLADREIARAYTPILNARAQLTRAWEEVLYAARIQDTDGEDAATREVDAAAYLLRRRAASLLALAKPYLSSEELRTLERAAS